MELFDFAWFRDFDTAINELRESAMSENWDYLQSPTGKNPVLSNYIKHTFKKVEEENKIEFEG